jgi:hypothetical protein
MQDMHVNEQIKNELQRLSNSLRRAMEQADCYSKGDLDDGLRESFWHDEYFRRKLDCELMQRVTAALEKTHGAADPTVRIMRSVPTKSTSNFTQTEVLRWSEKVLENAHKRLIEAKRFELKVTNEEELNEANCAVYRAEREYNDAVMLHIRALDLT